MKEDMIMTTHARRGAKGSQYDPLVEALLKELIDEATHPKAGKKTVTEVLTEELLASLKEEKEAGHVSPQEVSLETVIVAEALAPALAKELSEALAPALVKALNNLAASQKATYTATSNQETPSGENAE